MTDPWCWYIDANIDWGYIDGIHGTPYIAAPWILWVGIRIVTFSYKPTCCASQVVSMRPVLPKKIINREGQNTTLSRRFKQIS